MSAPGPLRSLLAPLTPLSRLGLSVRDRRLRNGKEPVRRLQFPVISIGNLSTGGSGKTPLTIALVQALTARSLHVDVLSRGYGRRDRQPAQVRLDGTAEESGDEPLLIARATQVPVFVAAHRYYAGQLAEAKFSSQQGLIHILDDGFQHRQLHRDLNLLLLSRQDWHDRLLPAGNLREPRSAAKRADAILIPAEQPEFEDELRLWGWNGPVWRLRRHMEVPPVDGPVMAFCGIARPEPFFSGLESAGLRLVDRQTFPDHHGFSRRDFDQLTARARSKGAVALLTTEKDLVRLASFEQRLPVLAVRLTVQIEQETAAVDWVLQRLEERKASPDGHQTR